MRYVHKTFQVGRFKVELVQDEGPPDPREDDNLGTMLCMHKRYDLGDKHNCKASDFGGWSDAEKFLRKEKGAVVVLPLYLYDHSGITISTKPFSCPWDSGQVGLISATREAVLENFLVKKLSKKILARATECLQSEVETYDQFLRGDVYGFVISGPDDEHLDSCWGCYGLEYCEDEARSVAERYCADDHAEAYAANNQGAGI